ncbi:MAG: multidrug effflux MFS transporter [Steroidobacteraceae bacterium]|jgi:DHA1 family bicyclomycin/chloramphenicol resistance-like MFS transporter|nr:multidrug effflux MFS transporter [Steroidobacteraceae bacterium]
MNAPLSDRALILLLAAVTAAGPVALNIYLPVLPKVQAEFAVSVAAASTTVTAPLIAFAIGILFYGPVSDRVGRRPVILFGLAVFLVGTLLALFAPSVGWLTAGRVVQALGTSAGITVARAVMSDLYPRDKMARMIAYLTMAMVLANALAPVGGGALAEFVDWRGVFALLLVGGIAITWSTWRHLPETRVPGTGSSAVQVLQASAVLATRPAFLGYVLQSGVVYATFLVFISLMPYVFVQGLGHSTTEYGSWYLAIAVGYFVGNWHVTRYAARLGVHRMMVFGVSIQAVSAVIAWGAAYAGWWHPAWIFLPWAVLGYGQGLALPNITASAVALAPQYAGAASGLLGFGQQLMGALSIQAMAVASTATPVPVATFVAAASLFALAWLPLMRAR